MKHPAARAVLLALISLGLSCTSQALAHDPASFQPIPDLISRVETILPPTWHIVEADTFRSPTGWSGAPDGVYIRVEDTRTRFFHPMGFHYYSFYRLWFMPTSWEGEMKETPYTTDSPPAFLLGINDHCIAFYQTAGGNVWEAGALSFCSVFGLDDLRIMDQAPRIIDLEMEEKLSTQLKAAERRDIKLNPQRIIGLTCDGPHLYLEYLLGPSESGLASDGMAQVTRTLAGDAFASFPQIESIYLRRCADDVFTDTLVRRN